MNNKLVNLAPLLFLAFASHAAVPYGAAPQQTGDLVLPPGEITAATPKILLIHGGGWTSEKYLRGTLADEAALSATLATRSITSTTVSRPEPRGR